MPKKSTLKWLETIQDKEVRKKAIKHYHADKDNLNCPFPPIDSLFGAISWAFTWVDTKEGIPYWTGVARDFDEKREPLANEGGRL